jgi:acetoin utilization deacetylase AcuC-like enzyme
MPKTGIVKDERYLGHDTGPSHVENPQRLVHIHQALADMGDLFTEIPARLATHAEIATIHDSAYIDRIAATAGKGTHQLDPDTVTSAKTYEAACLAAGGVMAAIDAVMGGLPNAFALVRPPGHHAERDRAMGFCIFNNVAIGAQHARLAHGLERILIVDWDLHHGNGTQHAFYTDPRVLYFSTHQYPYYPGTGHYTEIGEGAGRGYTVNCPLSPGCGDADYANIFRHILLPIALAYRPQLILVSAGFDIYHADPLGGMGVTEQGFARLTDILMELAQQVCAGRLVITLEGGYNVHGQALAVREVIRQMAGEAGLDRGACEQEEANQYPRLRTAIKTVQGGLKEFWPWPSQG